MKEITVLREKGRDAPPGVSPMGIAFWGGVMMTVLVAVMIVFLIMGERALQRRMADLSGEMVEAERMTRVIDALGDPGNDLLEDYVLEDEQRKLRRHRETLKTAWAAFDAMVRRHPALAERRAALLAHLDALRRETDAVFKAVEERRVRLEAEGASADVSVLERRAAAAMARMDRQSSLARAVMMAVRRHFLEEQRKVAASMQASFYAVCLLALVSFCSFIVGLVLLQRLRRAHRKAVALKIYVGSVVASIPSGLLVLSEGLTVLSANLAFRRMFRAPDADLTGQPLETVLPVVDLRLRAADALAGKGSREAVTLRFLTKAGWMGADVSDRYFRIALTPIQDSGVSDQGKLLAVVEDVTEQKRAELQTHRILNNAQDGVVAFDGEGKIVWANPSAEWMFGIGKAKLAGRSFISLLHEASRADYEKVMTALAEGERPENQSRSFRLQGRRADGTTFPVEMAVSGYQEEGNWFFTAFIRDKTEEVMAEAELEALYKENKRAYEALKEKQQQLVQSEKMASIGQLAAGVAHEINNPVGFVMSNIGRMREYSNDLFKLLQAYADFAREVGEKGREEITRRAAAVRAMAEEIQADFMMEDLPVLLDESLDGVKRVKEIVANLKAFSHSDKGSKVRFNLNEGLESTLKIAWNALKYDAEVIKDYGGIPPVSCRPQQINQVFMNLLVNAVHAIKEKAQAAAESSDKGVMNKKGKIRIRTYAEKGEVVAEIADTGAGIRKEHLEKIFDPFFTTKPVGKGTGLGLSISYGIIKKHGGRIEVESEPGVGTTFKVILPEAKAGDTGPEAGDEKEGEAPRGMEAKGANR